MGRVATTADARVARWEAVEATETAVLSFASRITAEGLPLRTPLVIADVLGSDVGAVGMDQGGEGKK